MMGVRLTMVRWPVPAVVFRRWQQCPAEPTVGLGERDPATGSRAGESEGVMQE